MTKENNLEEMSRTILAGVASGDVILEASHSQPISHIYRSKPKPRKAHIRKKEKERLLQPSPIPSDADLIDLRGRDFPSSLGVPKKVSLLNVVRVYDQVISLRQEVAELKEMIKELKLHTVPSFRRQDD